MTSLTGAFQSPSSPFASAKRHLCQLLRLRSIFSKLNNLHIIADLLCLSASRDGRSERIRPLPSERRYRGICRNVSVFKGREKQ